MDQKPHFLPLQPLFFNLINRQQTPELTHNLVLAPFKWKSEQIHRAFIYMGYPQHVIKHRGKGEMDQRSKIQT